MKRFTGCWVTSKGLHERLATINIYCHSFPLTLAVSGEFNQGMSANNDGL
jgi:hypothetical protein